jgi:hypothetical protein
LTNHQGVGLAASVEEHREANHGQGRAAIIPNDSHLMINILSKSSGMMLLKMLENQPLENDFIDCQMV